MENNNIKVHSSNETCNCPICSSGIEKRTFACMEIEGNYYILSANELAELDTYFEERKERDVIPEQIDVEDEKEYMLCYGSILPQSTSSRAAVRELVEKYKDYGFATLEDGKVIISAYHDVVMLGDENLAFEQNIPFACVLQTNLDMEEYKEFPAVLFLRYSNMSIWDNIFNRAFVLAVKDVETVFEGTSEEWIEKNWKKHIDYDRMKRVADTII